VGGSSRDIWLNSDGSPTARMTWHMKRRGKRGALRTIQEVGNGKKKRFNVPSTEKKTNPLCTRQGRLRMRTKAKKPPKEKVGGGATLPHLKGIGQNHIKSGRG